MYKILIGIILITTALTACETPAQPGTGGYDPEFQNLVAIATQTGAAVLISQTQAAQSATNQAIYAQQTAVSSYATATQVTSENATMQAVIQATAVSATETKIYEPVGVQQTRDAQAVLMARENAASTATAVAISAEIAANVKAAERWDWFWKGLFAFLVGLGAALVIAAINIALRFHKPVPPVYSDMGTVEAVDNRFYQLTNNVRPSYRAQPVLIDQPKEEPAPQPINNMARPVTWKVNGEEKSIEVNTQAQISDLQWYTFAHAVLVKEVGFSREAITEETWLSQGAYNAMYAQMAAWGMVETGEGEPEKLNNARCYEYLFNRLSRDEQSRVRFPHPDGKTAEI